tara:strand:- start:605 stop:769 length:165 start_codon:yes stop_codon:yes gene_type:complete
MIAIPHWLKTKTSKENAEARDQLDQMRQAIKNQTEKLEQAIKDAQKNQEVNNGN